jgi:hypothetical protein
MDKLETAVEQMKRDKLAEYEKHKQMAMEYERQMAMSQINYPNTNPLSGAHTHTLNYPTQRIYQPEKNSVNVYSLAEVQLTGGRMIAMTISAGPAIAKHLMDTMKSTGYLHMFNDVEALMIRSDEVVAVKLTKLTTE